VPAIDPLTGREREAPAAIAPIWITSELA